MQAAGASDLTDSRIRDDLLWCIAGTIDNVNGAVCRVIDRWLDDDALREDAAAAARTNDSARVQAFVFETLRFRTPTPVVVRRCVRTHTLGTATGHEKTIKAGTLVFVGLGTAMMDATVVDEPHRTSASAGQTLTTSISARASTTAWGSISPWHSSPKWWGPCCGCRTCAAPAALAGRLRCVGPFPASLTLDLRPS